MTPEAQSYLLAWLENVNWIEDGQGIHCRTCGSRENMEHRDGCAYSLFFDACIEAIRCSSMLATPDAPSAHIGRPVNAIRETGMECSKWSCRWFRWCAWVTSPLCEPENTASSEPSASVPVPERSRQNAGSSTQESTPDAPSAHQDDEDGQGLK